MIVYIAMEIYDPGAGDYSEDIISIHLNRKNAEEVVYDLLIKEEKKLRFLEERFRQSWKKDPPETLIEFYGDGGGRIGLQCWKVKEYEVEE